MKSYKVFETKRKLKQYGMAIVFIVILVFGWQYPLLGYFIPLCMLLGVGMGMFWGRKWCDWYCPRGSFYDALIQPVSAKKNIPPLFKKMYFRIGVFALLMLIMTVNLILRWPLASKIGLFFVSMLTTTTLLGIMLAFFFHQRSWCTICPIGTLIHLTGCARNQLKINSALCVECKLCAKVCPVQIKPYLYKGKGIASVKDKDCVKCGSCVAVCLKKASYF